MENEDLKNLEIENTQEEKTKEKGIFTFLKEIIPYIIILAVVLLIRNFLVTPIIVSGESMQPTLDGGEIMVLSKISKVDRFSVVVVDIGTEKIIKRVIALPGETISCENGVIYVNDRRQEDDYSQGIQKDFSKVTLGDDEYFVLGDNREHSLDSEELGPMKKEKIKGVVVFTLFPFDEFGSL